MNGNINYKYMVDLVIKLHSFIDEAETAIKQIYGQFNSSKNQLSERQAQEIKSLTAQYNSQQSGVKNQAQKIINDAQGIFNEILKLEDTLSESDKYFVKTKSKREQELADKATDKYDCSGDYFETLSDIKSRFQSLVVKYSGRKHRGIIDGMNYLISSKRKQDYEEIIILKNTIKKLIAEINDTIPALTDDSLNSFDQNFITQREALLKRHEAEMQRAQVNYSNNIENLADNICARLDGIISDELIDELSSAISEYDANYGKLDAQRTQFNNFIILGFLVYPYVDFIESSIVRQLIASKCEKLIDGNEIRLPVMCSLSSGFNWAVEINDVTSTNIEKFTHSAIYSFLSFSPVSKINFCIFDVENRGNSVLPFLELKKKVPDMFYGKVITASDEIRGRLYNLNNYIDDFIQNKLGNSYENIFEYNANNPAEIAPVTLLVIYDFPKGFDEVNLAELKNIMKNGSKCGIFTLICNNKNVEQSGYRDTTHNINAILEKCTQIKYEDGSFWLNSLELTVKPVPSNHDINVFADKYMLILEGRKNKGMVLPPLVRKIIEAKSGDELDLCTERIKQLQKSYKDCYGMVSENDVEFPTSVMLGSIGYPVEIFSQQTVDTCRDKDFTISGTENKFINIPFTCELDNDFNVFIQTDGENLDKITELSHVFMLSFLSSVPYGNVKVSVIDTEKRGNSIIPFLDFRKKAPEVFDTQIFTTQEAVSNKLKKLNSFIDEFIQDKLGNRYSDFVEYNLNSSSDRQPVQLLFIYDYPKEFDNKMHEQLINILKNGNKCGIYMVVIYNPQVSLSRYDSHESYIEQIKKISTCLECKGGKVLLAPYNLQLAVNGMISNTEMSDFSDKYIAQLGKAKNKGLSFKDIMAKQLFSCSSAKNLSIPMGVGSGNTIVNLVMGEGSSHHGLIAGATGSGKSTLLHTIIMSAMLNYSPEQLNLYLMDFKSGTEFKIYESVKLPHIKLLALDAMQEFGESILENLVAEMTNRGELFKSVGQTSLKGYAESMGKSLPRILVIMDEFQILFNDSTNRKIAMNCAELTKRIVTEGRAFGIHLLMATQSTKVIRDLTLQQGTIEQMRIRIGLKCGEDDARYLFTDRNDVKALEMMKGSIGTAVLNPEYNESANVGFKAAYCDKDTQKSYLELIASTYKDMDARPQIFEGNRTVKMVDRLKEEGVVRYEHLVTRIYLGEKIKVAPPFTLDVDRRRKHNMLICGTNERMCENLMNQYMLSVSLNSRNRIYCFDGDTIVGENASGSVYQIFESNSNFSLAKDRGEIITFVHDLYEKFKQARSSASDSNTFVFIKNLQWLDVVQKMLKDEYINESDYIKTASKPDIGGGEPFDWGVSDTPSSNESVSEQLRKMIDEGSSCGIYFIFGCTEYAVVKETMYYSDNILSKIPERIVFALNNNDADNLIDGGSVSQMKDNTVYFTDGVRNTFQFKPYVISSADDVKTILEREQL